jgi:hypothetical protein
VEVQDGAQRQAHNFLSIIKIINRQWLILINLEEEVEVEVKFAIIVNNLATCQEIVLKRKDRHLMEEDKEVVETEKIEVIEVIEEIAKTEEVIAMIEEIVRIEEVIEEAIITEVIEKSLKTIDPLLLKILGVQVVLELIRTL